MHDTGRDVDAHMHCTNSAVIGCIAGETPSCMGIDRDTVHAVGVDAAAAETLATCSSCMEQPMNVDPHHRASDVHPLHRSHAGDAPVGALIHTSEPEDRNTVAEELQAPQQEYAEGAVGLMTCMRGGGKEASSSQEGSSMHEKADVRPSPPLLCRTSDASFSN